MTNASLKVDAVGHGLILGVTPRFRKRSLCDTHFDVHSGGVEEVIGKASGVIVTLSGDSICLKPELGKGKPMAVDFNNGFYPTQ
jgi:hypothetical protein